MRQLMTSKSRVGTTNAICAIFTTYKPGSDIIQNVTAIAPQVEYVVVVDNGSSAKATSLLREASAELGFNLIENGRNLGIATALNQGCQWAIEHQCSFLLLLDQDSEATGEIVANLLRAYRNVAGKTKIGLIGAKVIERDSGICPPLLLDRNGHPTLTLTSGSLLPAPVFELCGPFEDALFIDYVDHEYCLRLRSLGYEILIADDAVLRHEVGFPRVHKLFWFWSCRCTHHAPARRYYYSRNLLMLLRRYWRTEPGWCKNEVKAFLKSTLKTFVFEEHRVQKLCFALRGAVDAMAGRMGEQVKL
jgi:rhamnosyltransferase